METIKNQRQEKKYKIAKPFKILLISVATLLILWTIGRLTGALQFYTLPTPSNEPTLKQGSKFFASNLIKPERFDFICYKADVVNMGRTLVTHRLCGLPGDILEIKNGDLYINGESVDGQFNLLHSYLIPENEFAKIKQELNIQDEEIHWQNDTVKISLSTKVVQERKINAKRFLVDKNIGSEEIEMKYQKGWNIDFFGPLQIPAGKYFTVGDNRHNAYDSRYSGLIDKKEIVATILGK